MPRSAFAGVILAIVGLALMVVLVAACGPSVATSAPASAGASSPPASGPGASNGSPFASSEPAAVVWLPDWAGNDVPSEVTDRRALPFCGVERAPAPQAGIFVDRAIRLCFWNAHLAHGEAEFVSIQSTIEGAAIATVYRLAPDGSVQVLTDFTQDPLGGGKWILANCSEIVEGEGNELLGVSGCDDGVPLD
jgi:hypothetical protein